MSHPTTFFIRPTAGLKIRDPQTGEYLPEAGALMPRSGFWLRRLGCGDVIQGDVEVVKTSSPKVRSEKKPALDEIKE